MRLKNKILIFFISVAIAFGLTITIICWQRIARGVIQIDAALQKCLWCGIHVFDGGKLVQIDDTNAYFEVDDMKVYLRNTKGLQECMNSIVYIEGFIQKPFWSNEIQMSKIQFIVKIVDGMSTKPECYISPELEKSRHDDDVRTNG